MTGEAPVELLIVDDLPENLLALEALVRQPGCTVHQALSGDAALELLLQHDFALAILDVQMPGMTGFQLAELMRGTERTRHIPIVFVTAAGGQSGYAFKGYESGAVDFLHKPLDPTAVQSKVRVFVDLYRQRGRVRRQVEALEQSRRDQQSLLTELQATQQQLQSALRARDDFMSLVAHELRTPLSVLSLDGQVREAHLRKGNLAYFGPEQLQRMVAKDRRQVQSMARLIEDMLDVSRIRSGALSIQRETVDLSVLLQQLVADFSSLNTGMSLTVDAAPGVVGHWDAFRLEQVVVNLLTNAQRYGAGQPVRVSLRQQQGGVAEIQVQDGGHGIAVEDQQRIFEPFVRVGSKASANGLGLGLYVARQLVEAHGGQLTVQSSPGAGAMFSVRLPPVQPGQDAADAAPGGSAACSAQRCATPGAPSGLCG